MYRSPYILTSVGKPKFCQYEEIVDFFSNKLISWLTDARKILVYYEVGQKVHNKILRNN
jgi:hypothetical protein